MNQQSSRYRFNLLNCLTAFIAVGMLIQLGSQLVEVQSEGSALLACVLLGGFGFISGREISHSRHTQLAIRCIAFVFFLALGYQWSAGFRDELLVWSLRWLSVGLIGGSFFPASNFFRFPAESEEADDSSQDEWQPAALENDSSIDS